MVVIDGRVRLIPHHRGRWGRVVVILRSRNVAVGFINWLQVVRNGRWGSNGERHAKVRSIPGVGQDVVVIVAGSIPRIVVVSGWHC